MKRLIIAVMIGFFLGGFFPGTNAWCEPADYMPSFWPGGESYPKTVLEEAIHDYGMVKPGLHIKYDFKVKNEGEAPLVIKRVTPG